jgi:hypothetical protein
MEIRITYCGIDGLYYVRLYRDGGEVAELGRSENKPTSEAAVSLYHQWQSLQSNLI